MDDAQRVGARPSGFAKSAKRRARHNPSASLSTVADPSIIASQER